MIFIKYDEYGNISQTQNITESIGQNSLKANMLYIAFPNVVKSYISMIKEYKCYITFERSDGIKISDLPCTPVSKTIDGIEYFGYLYSFSSKQVTACAGSLIVSPRLFSINSDGEETIAVIGANQTLSVSPSVVESEVVSNLSEAEKNALVDMIQNQHIMWLEKKYNNYSAIEVFTSLMENSMSDGIYISFDRKRLFVYERTTESICFGEFIKNGIVKNETGIYKYDNEENFEYIKIDDLKTGNLSDLPFAANSIVEALNKIIDGTELVGNAISATYADTSNNTYRDSEDNLITTYYASKSALSQANKEIANLKETLYGYVLDTTDIEISDIIPSTATIGSNTYNLVDNVYGLVKEVKGNTIKSENLLILEDKAETTTNGITYSIKNGVITLNGTCSKSFYLELGMNTSFTDVMVGMFGNISDLISIRTWDVNWQNDSSPIYSNNFKHINSVYNIRLTISIGQYNNAIIKPMLVKGSTAPTEFSKGFDGLKSVTYNGLNINGINLMPLNDFENTTLSGVTATLNKNGTILLNGTSTGYPNFKIGHARLSKGTYYLPNHNNTNLWLYVGTTSGGRDILNLQSITILQFTLEKDTEVYFSFTLIPNFNTNNFVVYPFLSKSVKTINDFRPYIGQTILNNFDEPIFLRGVGTAKDKIVITKNEDNEFYTATSVSNTGYIRLGSLKWSLINDGAYNIFLSSAITDIKAYNENVIPNLLTKGNYTLINTLTGASFKSNDYDKKYTIRAYQHDIMVQDASYTDATSFRNAINDLWMVYELATPTSKVISSTLTDSDVMPLLELGGTVEIVGEDGELGSTVVEMVYRLSNTGV